MKVAPFYLQQIVIISTIRREASSTEYQGASFCQNPHASTQTSAALRKRSPQNTFAIFRNDFLAVWFSRSILSDIICGAASSTYLLVYKSKFLRAVQALARNLLKLNMLW